MSNEMMVLEIRKSSYKERLQLFALRYAEIRQKYETGDKFDEVGKLMADFETDYYKLEEEMKQHGLTIDDVK